MIQIHLSEKTGEREMSFSWLPEEIHFSSNGTRFASYNILEKGEVKIPAGANLHKYSWEGILPGEAHKNLSIISPDWKDPHWIQGVWSLWRNEGTVLRLLITGTPINHDVYLEDYEVSYTGAFGDYHYSISFIDARDISLVLYNPQREQNADVQPKVTRSETQSSTKSYTVVQGDTLWSISQKFLKDGSKWEKIYNKNQEIIESMAKKYGRSSSDHGHWIYPGTKLKLPS